MIVIVIIRDETIRSSYDTIRIDTKGDDMVIFDTIRVIIVTRGPWVAHLRKRSKVTVEPKIENHRGNNLNNFGRGPFDDVIYQI